MIRTISLALLAFTCSSSLAAQAAPPPAPAPQQPAPQQEVSVEQLRQTIDALVGFGTRHTLSAQDDPARGIGAARTWAEHRFRTMASGCSGCLQIVTPEEIVSGNRVPVPTRLVNILAIQRGSERPDEVVIISAHIDSRVSDVMDATSDAPGANDDGSGVAAVIEAARVLSRHRFPTTIVYAILSGEEQGLYGGRLLAAYARQQNWTVKALLNNDIIGGSRGSDGVTDNQNVRVFSEGARADSIERIRALARREGGENDSPSRNISRWIDRMAQTHGLTLGVRQIWRADRFGRGGDQLPAQEIGIPAVRLSAAIEDYTHQHQDLRTEQGIAYGDTAQFMDFPYLGDVTRLNVTALAGLASSPMPPAPAIEGAVSTSTTLRWAHVAGADHYLIYRRRTDERDWAEPVVVQGNGDNGTAPLSHILPGIRLDDWVFGVASVAADGSESPVASAVPGGAFAPIGG